MVAIGDVRHLRVPSKENLFGFVLQVNRSKDEALVALVSNIETPNFTRIKVSDELSIYPAVQASLSTLSLGRLLKVNVSGQLESLPQIVHQWLAYPDSQKLALSKDFNNYVQLGQSHVAPDIEFLAHYEQFFLLSEQFHASESLGIQFQADAFEEEFNVPRPFDLIQASTAAIYAERKLGNLLRQTVDSKMVLDDNSRRVLLRRAANIRALRNPMPSKSKQSPKSLLFDFMDLAQVNPMTYVISSNEQDIRPGTFRRGFRSLTVKMAS
jgi:hypothetical protein